MSKKSRPAKSKKKTPPFVERLGHALSDVANVASVAATGSEIGVLELAAEEELNPTTVPRKRKPASKRRNKTKSRKRR